MMQQYSLAVDIGGTFTEAVLLDMSTGAIAVDKALSTPRNPLVGLCTAVQGVLNRVGTSPQAVAGVFVHATTIVTNNGWACAPQCRASSINVSQLLGISPQRMGMLALTSAAAIGGLGRVLITPAQYTSFDVGLTYGIYGFVAAVLGAFGRLWGALIGGIIVGFIEALTGRYISTAYETFIALAVLLALLAFRPKGIFGGNWQENKERSLGADTRCGGCDQERGRHSWPC
jgi:branched-subunit amino acid ABC-type transport system permease component